MNREIKPFSTLTKCIQAETTLLAQQMTTAYILLLRLSAGIVLLVGVFRTQSAASTV